MFYESDVYSLIKEAYKTREYKGSVAVYGWVTKEGRVVHATNTACHAQIGYMGVGHEYVYSGISNTNLTVEERIAFVECLLASKSYSWLFETKDAKRIVEDEFYVVSCDKPTNLAMSLFILSRTPKEYPQVAKHIGELYKGGINPDLAIFLGHSIREINNNWCFDRHVGGHHEALSNNYGKRYVHNMINGVFKESSSLKVSPRYSGVQAVFAIGRLGGDLRTFVRTLITAGKHIEYKTPFPAYHKIDGELALHKREVIKTLVDNQDKIIAWVGSDE